MSELSTDRFLEREIDTTIDRIDECIAESRRWMALANYYETHLAELRGKLGEVAVAELAPVVPIFERRLEVVRD